MTATVRVNHADTVLDALRAILPSPVPARAILPSPVPALVFTSLAGSRVPTVSDHGHVLLHKDGLGAYAIQRPLEGADADLQHWGRDVRAHASVGASG